jgi:hypothetical protein
MKFMPEDFESLSGYTPDECEDMAHAANARFEAWLKDAPTIKLHSSGFEKRSWTCIHTGRGIPPECKAKLVQIEEIK